MMPDLCQYDEAFTIHEMHEETGQCSKCSFDCVYAEKKNKYKPIKDGTWTDGFTDYDRWRCRKCGQHLKMMFGPKEDIHWCPKCGNPVEWD